jgi:hypothetical protein
MDVVISSAILAPGVQRLRDVRDYFLWLRKRHSSPTCGIVKRQVLRRHGIAGATWIETGTYRGDTTSFLSRISPKVISIEPDIKLFTDATKRFKSNSRVTLINDTSEGCFESTVKDIIGPTCFWLDGHFSGAGTFLASIETPIQMELEVLATYMDQLSPLVVFIDDFREFSSTTCSERSTYPPSDYLTAWSKLNGLAWAIEHDIFIAKPVGLPLL